MNNKQYLHRIVRDLRDNYPSWDSTFGPCINGCKTSARGAGLCANCCEKALAKLTTKALASDFHESVKIQSEAYYAIINYKKEGENG